MMSSNSDYQSCEQAIVSTNATVLFYDGANGKWSQSGSRDGCSKVSIYQHIINTSFRVVARHLETREVTLNSMITYNLRYNKATDTFHQWRDSVGQVYGLSFISADEAERFSEAMVFSLDTLGKINEGSTQILSPSSQGSKLLTSQVNGVKETSGTLNTQISNNSNISSSSNNNNDNEDVDGVTTKTTALTEQHGGTEQNGGVKMREKEQKSFGSGGRAKLGSSRAKSKESKSSSRQEKAGGAPPPPPPPPPPLPPLLPPASAEINKPKHEEVEQSTALDLASALKGVKLKKTTVQNSNDDNAATIKSEALSSGSGAAGSVGRSSGPPPLVKAKSGDMMSEMNRRLAERRNRANNPPETPSKPANNHPETPSKPPNNHPETPSKPVQSISLLAADKNNRPKEELLLQNKPKTHETVQGTLYQAAEVHGIKQDHINRDTQQQEHVAIEKSVTSENYRQEQENNNNNPIHRLEKLSADVKMNPTLHQNGSINSLSVDHSDTEWNETLETSENMELRISESSTLDSIRSVGQGQSVGQGHSISQGHSIGQGHDYQGQGSLDQWQSLRQEIVSTIREEVERAKQEILNTIRQEIRGIQQK